MSRIGSIASTAHRRIPVDFQVRSARERCERGEDSAVSAYREAINSGNLPDNIVPIVQRQFNGIQQTHDRIKQMRDAKAATTKH